MAKGKSKTPELDWISLCDAIDDGDYDEGLVEIARTIQTRLDVRDAKRARRLIAELEQGTRVMITNKPTPRYLNGMVGTIRKLDIPNTAAHVELDDLPVRTGPGRPGAAEKSKRIVISLIHVMKLDEELMRVDPADIGDDDDEEDDD